MYKAYLGLGSNLGNRNDNLLTALEHISLKCFIYKVSSIYVSRSLLEDLQDDYFNLVAIIMTELTPLDLLQEIQNIENIMGRDRTVKFWGERIIDIDIISFDNYIIDSKALSIPHKEACNRSFVLYPIQEIDPDYVHPVTEEKIDTLILKLDKDMDIRKETSIEINLK